jgi:hypothetical protein
MHHIKVQTPLHGPARTGGVPGQRPCDPRSHLEDGGVYGYDLAGYGVQSRIVRQLADPANEIVDQRLQQFQVEDPLRVGQSTLGNPRQTHAPSDFFVFENIFDRAQAGDRRIKESKKMGNEYVIREQLAVPMHGASVNRSQLLLKQPDQPPSGDRLLSS